MERRASRIGGGPAGAGATARLAVALAVLAGSARADADPPPGARSAERRTGPVVVEAVRPAELPEDPSSFTTVLEADDFEGEQGGVEDWLGRTVGVQVRRFGGPGELSEISIRGSSPSQVVVLLDGVRLNSPQSGTVDLSTLPAALIERIEISRGGGSIRTGSDGIGGVVDVATLRPSATPELTVVGSGGSFDTWHGSLAGTGAWGSVETALGYDFFRTEGDWEFQPALRVRDGVPTPPPPGAPDSLERINNRTENHAAFAKLARGLGDRWRVSLTEHLFYGSSGEPGPDLGGGAFYGQSRTAHRRRTRNVAKLAVEAAEVTPLALGGELALFHRFERNRFREPDPGVGVAVDSDDRTRALGARLRVERASRTGFSAHRTSLGLELRRDALDSEGGLDPRRGVLGVFLQDDAALLAGRLRLVPALRLDATEGFGSEWVPRLGAIVSLLPGLRLKGNVERSYRVPNFDELFVDEAFLRGNEGLRPEEAWNFDVGLELGLARLGPLSDVSLECAFFHQEIEESIVFQVVSPSLVQATNTNDARVRGVELAFRFAVLGWLTLSGNFTQLDTRVDRTGRPLPGRADWEHTLRAALSPPGGAFRLVAERHATGEIPTNAAGNQVVGQRAVYDLHAALDLAHVTALSELARARRLLVSVTATNVTDESVRDASFYPQPGRTVSIRLEGQW